MCDRSYTASGRKSPSKRNSSNSPVGPGLSARGAFHVPFTLAHLLIIVRNVGQSRIRGRVRRAKDKTCQVLFIARSSELQELSFAEENAFLKWIGEFVVLSHTTASLS